MKRKLLLTLPASITIFACAFTLTACGGGKDSGHVHNIVADEAVEATCMTYGLTEGSHCASCGTVIVAQQQLPFTDHAYRDGVCTVCLNHIPTEGLKYVKTDDGYEAAGPGTATDADIYIASTYNGELVVSVMQEAFLDCGAIKSVTIPDSVTSIGDWAFQNCSGLTSITVPDSVTSVGNGAFSGCSSLTSIAIPDSVTSIGDGAFINCSKLSGITVANGNTKYHSAGNCIIETATKTLIVGCKASIIPADGSVTSVGYSAFYGCSGLTSITVPDGVTFIDGSSFYGCTGLTDITVASGNTKYHSAGNCIIETATKTLILGCKASIIPTDGSVTAIGNSAFYGCSSLTSITVPDGVTSIGSSAFSGCSNLTSITVPDSVTYIDGSAFMNCTRLTSINFNGTKAQWTAIEKFFFWNCNTGSYTVRCTDGNLDKTGNVVE